VNFPEDMYSFETIFEGVKYSVYLFASFTGIIQPFMPEDPITAEEIHTENMIENLGTSYVQAWYSETQNEPRLDMIKTVHLGAEAFEVEATLSETPGTHYYRIYKNGGQVGIGEEMNAMDAIHEIEYLRHVIIQDGSLKSSLLIHVEEYDIHRYKYNEQGVLTDRRRDIISAGERVPDF
jgi:hypothetical protein